MAYIPTEKWAPSKVAFIWRPTHAWSPSCIENRIRPGHASYLGMGKEEGGGEIGPHFQSVRQFLVRFSGMEKLDFKQSRRRRDRSCPSAKCGEEKKKSALPNKGNRFLSGKGFSAALFRKAENVTVFEALNLEGVKDSMNTIKRGMHFHVTFVLLRSHTAEVRNQKHFSSLVEGMKARRWPSK